MSFQASVHGSAHLQGWHESTSRSSQTTSTTTAYAVLISILLYYTFGYLDPVGLPLSEILWNAIVWITPSRLIARIDSSFEAVMAENSMSTKTSFNSKGHASKSNAMRRILGLDGAGIVTNMQKTRTLSDLGGIFTQRQRSSPPGLGNWDNSCYQNSVLQGLAALESLPDFLNEDEQSDVPQPTKSALRDFITRLNDPANVGKTFWTPAELKSMSSWQQQDAQEYFSKISDGLEKDTSNNVKQRRNHHGLERLSPGTIDVIAPNRQGAGHTTESCSPCTSKAASRLAQMPEELASLIVRNPLEGLLAQRVGCQKCGFVEGLSLVPFNCLTVPLGREWTYDIQSCLHEYTALEPINGVECTKCTLLHAKQSLEQVIRSIQDRNEKGDQAADPSSPHIQQSSMRERLNLVNQALENQEFSDQALKKCQITPKSRISTTKSRQAVIARTPRCLVIHVNRSNFDELTGMQSKNLAHVRFPKRLNLAPWCLGHSSGMADPENAIEGWNTDPSKSMLTDDILEDDDASRGYELRAVITHYGRHENGHYICYRKSPDSSQTDEQSTNEDEQSWWRLSDEDVTEVDEKTVLSQGGVFMLFYEQMTPLLHPRFQETPLQQAETANVGEALDARLIETTSTANEYLSPNPASKEHSDEHIEPAFPTPPPTPPQLYQRRDPESPVDSPGTIPNPDIIDPISDLPSRLLTLSPSTSPLNQPERSKNLGSALSETRDVPSKLPKENQPVSPASMRTAAPRNSRGSVGRAGKAMESVAGFVQAN